MHVIINSGYTTLHNPAYKRVLCHSNSGDFVHITAYLCSHIPTLLNDASLGISDSSTPCDFPWSMKACLRASDGAFGTGIT